MKTRLFVIGFILITVLLSCKTVYVPYEKEVIRRDSIYRSVHTSDTVIWKDTVKITIRGECADTTIIKWREKIINRTDTFYVDRSDTLYVEKPIIPEGYKKDKWYDYVLKANGCAFLILLFVLAIIGLLKLKKKFI